MSLTGADISNYALQTSTYANITPATLTINGLTASNKVYDATTVASLNGTASVSALGADQIAISGTAAGNFADKNVGNQKVVNISGLSLTGLDAGNYTLLNGATTANITPAMLILSASMNTKNYNGTIDAAAIPTVSGLRGGDSISRLYEVYVNGNPGLNKVINVSGGYVINDGNNGNNYIVQLESINTGIILPQLANSSTIVTSIFRNLTSNNFKLSNNSDTENSKLDDDIQLLNLMNQEFPGTDATPLNTNDESVKINGKPEM